MTTGSSKPPPAKTAPQHAAIDKTKKIPTPRHAESGFLANDPVALDVVVNEQVEIQQHKRLLSLVFTQGVTVAILAGFLLFIGPFVQPVYHYFALDPAGNTMPLVGLTMPNMTNRAILSWTINSVTEIMTFGFGDFESKTNKQSSSFTTDGWKSFVSEFKKQKVGEIFKHNQLVLTTVPSNVPVIISQGQNKQGVYQWEVQVPVIMTYTTNNNQTQHDRTVVTLTIVRVPPSENPDGIAIKVWRVRV
jgi:hypothetical protein